MGKFDKYRVGDSVPKTQLDDERILHQQYVFKQDPSNPDNLIIAGYLGDVMGNTSHISIPGVVDVKKYGRAIRGINAVMTDIWDRADVLQTQPVWIAPTEARIHSLQSNDADDAAAGEGAKIVRVYGLVDWDSEETYEDVVLDGVTPVNTVNAYVIIHRMKVISYGTNGPNVGTIIATAAVDGTITAQITAGVGQTLMAIYGIPSSQDAYMSKYMVGAYGIDGNFTGAQIDFEMVINEQPNVHPNIFINKSNQPLITTGASRACRDYDPYYKIQGPAIIKFRAQASADGCEGSAEFDVVLVNK